MVKFSILALATAIASVSATSTTKKTINLGNRQLRANSPSTKALMKHAIKVKGGRRLEDGEEMQITGSHYMQFDECIDVTTYDEELIQNEDMVSYAKSGDVVSVANFVKFYLTNYEGQGMDYSGDAYMVPLATWLTNMAKVHAEERQNYCEGCDYEYCYPEQEEEEEEEEEQQEEEEGEEGKDFWLLLFDGRTIVYCNCFCMCMLLNALYIYFYVNFNIKQKKIERRKMKRARKVMRVRVVRICLFVLIL